MKPFIVVADGCHPEIFEKIKSVNDFEVYPEPKISKEKLEELLPRLTGLVVRSATQVNQELIDKAPQLKYVIRAGEGTDNIDKAYCEQKGIKVSNTPGANSNSAAEHALALMLTVLRKTAWAHGSMKSGKWEKSLFSGNELANKNVGIIGFGRIGQILAKRLSGFEPQIMFYDHHSGVQNSSTIRREENLEKIFSESDIISIHLPKNKETQNLITKKYLSLMKNGAILINVARGGIVNEDDLYEVLNNKDIRGAGLDVFSSEPLQETSPLRKLENVVLTPHLGASTEEAQFRVNEMVLTQLKNFFIENKLVNEVKA
jgi:D-3-phosphoglycerate dehydrogenase